MGNGRKKSVRRPTGFTDEQNCMIMTASQSPAGTNRYDGWGQNCGDSAIHCNTAFLLHQVENVIADGQL